MKSESNSEGLVHCSFTMPVSKNVACVDDPDPKRKETMSTGDQKNSTTISGKKRGYGTVLDFSCHHESQQKRQKHENEALVPRVSPFKDIRSEIKQSKFGSAFKDMQNLIARREQVFENKRYERTELGSSTHRGAPQNRQESPSSSLVRKDPFALHLLEQVNYSKFGADLDDVMVLVSRIKAKRQHSETNSPLECKTTYLDQGTLEDSVETNQSKTPLTTYLEQGTLEDSFETNQSKTPLVIIPSGDDDDDDGDHKNAVSEELCLSPTRHHLTGPLIILDSSDDEDSELYNSFSNGSLQNFKDSDFPNNQKDETYALLPGVAEITNIDRNVHNVKISCEAEEQSANQVEPNKKERAYLGQDKSPSLEAKSIYVACDGISYEEEQLANEVDIEKEKTTNFSKENENNTKEFYEDGMHTGIEDETGLEECSGGESYAENEGEEGTNRSSDEDSDVESEREISVKQADVDDNRMADIWMEMGVAIECSKETVNIPTNVPPLQNMDCDHIYILKDDIGYVCRVCGLIQQAIDEIIEYQFRKVTRSRTYWHEGRSSNAEPSVNNLSMHETSTHDFNDNEIYPHPRHRKQMKPHQTEGFNFLVRNLMTETPGGCILAHAPGSGKTFMLISFLQSFMARHPLARPLVVLPRGIISTWKHEFERWQVENFPLYDLYSLKAESRSQQLEVLQNWAQKRSILFLGYMQFSSIICDLNSDEISIECQEILLTCPSILILDEGHTARNRDTDVLISLEKVQTPRKVVLSGTLFQNHVEEVFNVLNLVRPKFLKMDSSKAIKRRILSRVMISKNRNLMKNCSDKDFYDLVETTILKDDNFARKVSVIQDLRDMTSKVLHYYKGDYLDELPGLVDFAIHLKLSPVQEKEVVELEKLGNKFKKDSEGSVLYVHPDLKKCSRDSRGADDENIDKILDTLDINDGVKAKFFLNLLQLCESNSEKLLVFSQYVLPLTFLRSLAIRVQNYSDQKEIFMITGDSSSDQRELSMERFNNSADARVFFGSIKACGEGISLVGASRIIILDVHLNPSVTRQAIGRAFRPGQTRKVYVYRLIAHNSLEVENHKTCFKKESISKLWFEWNEYYGNRDYELEAVDFKNCGDMFLESRKLNQDVHSVFRR